jgi:hypothetical protein
MRRSTSARMARRDGRRAPRPARPRRRADRPRQGHAGRDLPVLEMRPEFTAAEGEGNKTIEEWRRGTATSSPRRARQSWMTN